jgi:hypothetical protein
VAAVAAPEGSGVALRWRVERALSTTEVPTTKAAVMTT